ncbi:TonB-dependent receptor [Hymenobacter sp. BT189]|uniref:TonB-dependent receptor n=1 Tax=Hymenobacter armeniacus TaxID=2771358 RepID=A0ABR8JTC8_9BACT|nr:TonB-dependent receptor [Hymenobacter armeniacus]
MITNAHRERSAKPLQAPLLLLLTLAAPPLAGGGACLAAAPLAFQAPAQAKGPITGRVTTAKGEPLIGVTVQVKGTNRGESTDVNGNFSINVPEADAVLVLSYIGFVKQEVPVNGRTTLAITLAEDQQALEEVVVVGYGTQDKLSVTGAISSVKSQDILKAPVSSVANALAGRTPGVVTTQRGGEPGRDVADIYVRGIATFAPGANRQPLVLVDGVERSLASIDPYTIENFSVLKDASATAVFGIRGANGVIIITTKTGAIGKPEVSLSTNFAVQNPIRLPQLLNAVDYATLRNEAARNDDPLNPNARLFSDSDIEHFRTGDDPYFHPNVNWFDYMLRKYAPQQQYNVNISGGNKDAKYFVSLGHLNQDGAYKIGDFFDDFSANPNYKRYNIRANFDFNVTKKLTLFFKSGFDITKGNYSGSATSDIFGTILSANPMMSPIIYDGKVVRNVSGLTGLQVSNTPLYQMLNNGFNSVLSSNLNTNVGARYNLDQITPGLAIRGQVAYDNYYLQDSRRSKLVPLWDLERDPANPTSPIPVPIINQFEGPVVFGADNYTKYRKVYAEGAVEYKHSFGNHGLTALALTNAERAYRGGNELPYNLLGFVGRATYDYQQKYFAELNIGYNGSENFAKGKQFGFFPSGSLGYLVSQESFFPKNDYFTFFKVRGSYGAVGNDKIGGRRFLFTPDSYRLVTANSFNNNVFHTGLNHTIQNGYTESLLGNPDVTWERAVKWNIGADLKFFKDKLSVSGDVFKEVRNDILYFLNLPVTFGDPNLVAPYNIGKAENHGFELDLNYQDKVGTSGLGYWVNANYSFARNKIVYQDETPQPYPGLAYTGSRIGQLKGLLADGIYNTVEEIPSPSVLRSEWQPNLKPGDIRYVDVNGDGIINNNDQVNIGNPNVPEIIYGTSFGVNFKGFELSVLFQGTANVSTYLTGESVWPFVAGTKTAFENAKESWSQQRYESGQPISLPRLTASPEANKHNYRMSSFWLQDASYVRLKNLELGYNFNPNLVRLIGLKGARLYVNGQNLYTWTKMKYFDPEIANSNGSVYPMVRVFNVGANLRF